MLHRNKIRNPNIENPKGARVEGSGVEGKIPRPLTLVLNNLSDFSPFEIVSDFEFRIHNFVYTWRALRPFDVAQDMLCASHGFSETIAMSTSSRSAFQISNDSLVYEFQPRISILRGRGNSTEYSAFIRPGLAVRSTIRSAR
jgi:hypothetical protein